MTKLLLLFNFKFTMLLGGGHLPLSVDLSHFTSVCSRNCTWLCNLQLALHSVQLWNVCLISKSGEDLQSMASRWSDLAFFKLGLVIRKLSAELHWGNLQGVVFKGTPEGEQERVRTGSARSALILTSALCLCFFCLWSTVFQFKDRSSS